MEDKHARLVAIEDALQDAFPDPDELERLAWRGLRTHLVDITPKAARPTMISRLVAFADARDRLETLLDAARQINSSNLALRNLVSPSNGDNHAWMADGLSNTDTLTVLSPTNTLGGVPPSPITAAPAASQPPGAASITARHAGETQVEASSIATLDQLIQQTRVMRSELRRIYLHLDSEKAFWKRNCTAALRTIDQSYETLRNFPASNGSTALTAALQRVDSQVLEVRREMNKFRSALADKSPAALRQRTVVGEEVKKLDQDCAAVLHEAALLSTTGAASV